MTTPPITREERERIASWADVTHCHYIEVRPSTISGYEAALTAAEGEIERLERQVERDVDFLTSIQFSGASFRCPSCGGQPSSGHSPKCALVAAQRIARAALEGEKP